MVSLKNVGTMYPRWYLNRRKMVNRDLHADAIICETFYGVNLYVFSTGLIASCIYSRYGGASNINKFLCRFERAGIFVFTGTDRRQKRRKSFYANMPCHRGMCLLDFSPDRITFQRWCWTIDLILDSKNETRFFSGQFQATQRDHVQLIREVTAFFVWGMKSLLVGTNLKPQSMNFVSRFR